MISTSSNKKTSSCQQQSISPINFYKTVKSIREFLESFNIPESMSGEYTRFRHILGEINNKWYMFSVNNMEWLTGPYPAVLSFVQDYFELALKKIRREDYIPCLYELVKEPTLKQYKKILKSNFKISYDPGKPGIEIFKNYMDKRIVDRIIQESFTTAGENYFVTPPAFLVKTYRQIRKVLVWQ